MKKILILIIILATIIQAIDVDLYLEKGKYAQNEKLTGYINLTIENETISYFSNLSLKIDNQREYITLAGFLENESIDYEFSNTTYDLESSSTSKTITLPNAVALKLPQNIDIRKISLDLSGSSINNLKLNINEEQKWAYEGEFEGWKSDAVKSDTLGSEYGSLEIKSNHSGNYAFCQLIEINNSKDFNIRVKAKKTKDGGPLLKAAIVSIDTPSETPTILGRSECTLETPTSLFEWKSCTSEIETTFPLNGKYLACVYSATDTHSDKHYTIRTDALNQEHSSYYCSFEDSTCTESTSVDSDFFIKVLVGDYDSSLSGTEAINETSIGPIISAIEDVITDCVEEDEGQCIIPLEFKADSSKSLGIKNLNIEYEDDIGNIRTYDQIYSTENKGTQIITIDDENLKETETILKIPLTYFNFKIQEPRYTRSRYSVYAYIHLPDDSESESKSIIITEATGIEDEGELKETVDNLLEESKSRNNQLTSENKRILTLFGFEDQYSRITDAETEISNLDKINNSEDKITKLWNLESSLNTYLELTPQKISKQELYKDTLITEPSDLDRFNFPSETKELIASEQNNINVNVNSEIYTITYHDNKTEKFTLITKTITPEAPIAESYIYEQIPKNIAQTASLLSFENTNVEIVESDPVVRFYFDSFSGEQEIKYAVKGSKTGSDVADTKSVIVPKDAVTTITNLDYQCGDGYCTSGYETEENCPSDCKKERNIFLIILIVILILFILLIGIYYIYSYKGKYSPSKIRSKKSPFKDKNQLNSLKNFIEVSLNKGMNKKEIASVLLRKKWSKEQIIYALEDVEWDKRVKFTLSVAPLMRKEQPQTQKTGALSEYITKCRDLKIKDIDIKLALIKKGWSEFDVDAALKRNKPSKKKFSLKLPKFDFLKKFIKIKKK